MDTRDLADKGLQLRKQMFGEAAVDEFLEAEVRAILKNRVAALGNLGLVPAVR